MSCIVIVHQLKLEWFIVHTFRFSFLLNESK